MNTIVQQFEYSLASGTRMKTDLFHSCGHCWVFQICWHTGCSTLMTLSFRILNSWAGIVLCFSPVAYWTPSHLGGAHLTVSYLFAFSYYSWGSFNKNTGVISISSSVDHVWQNSSLWLVHLGWPCKAWRIPSLSYASPFTTTRLWSMKGKCRLLNSSESPLKTNYLILGSF